MVYPGSTFHTLKLYLSTSEELIQRIEDVFQNGDEVVSFSPTSPFQQDLRNNIWRADWLIVYKRKTKDVSSRY